MNVLGASRLNADKIEPSFAFFSKENHPLEDSMMSKIILQFYSSLTFAENFGRRSRTSFHDQGKGEEVIGFEDMPAEQEYIEHDSTAFLKGKGPSLIE